MKCFRFGGECYDRCDHYPCNYVRCYEEGYEQGKYENEYGNKILDEILEILVEGEMTKIGRMVTIKRISEYLNSFDRSKEQK